MSGKKIIILSILSMVFMISAGSVMGGFSNTPSTTNLDPRNQILTRLWEDTGPINALVVGDVDSTHQGSEIVCGGDSGQVTLIEGSGNNWLASPIQNFQSSIRFLGVGDLDPLHEGNEVVVATYQQHSSLGNDPGHPPETWGIRMLENDGMRWTSTLVFSVGQSVYNLWSVRVGDFNTSHPGDEICASWEFMMDVGSVHVYTYNGISLSDTLIYTGNGAIMDVNVGDFNTSHPGSEMILLNENNQYIQLTEKENIWEPTVIWNSPTDYAGKQVEIGDVDSQHLGNELVIQVRMLPGILLLENYNNKWVSSWILRSSSLITDISIDDINSVHNGNEVVAVSDRNVTMIWGSGHHWYHQNIGKDVAPLHCVTSGDFDGSSRGDELAIAGESQFVSRIIYQPLAPFAYPPGEKLTCSSIH